MRPAWEFGIEKDSLEEEKTDGGGGAQSGPPPPPPPPPPARGAHSGLLSTTPSRVF